MVVKKAWIPTKGTYSIGSSNEPFNPTIGDISFVAKPPSEINHALEDEKAKAQTYSDLLQDNDYLADFLNVASLANLAHVHLTQDGSWIARGDPTEIAIQVFASRFDWNRTKLVSGDNPQWKQIAEFPFDSDVKKMSVIFKETRSDKLYVFTKGAVERIIGSCTWMIPEEGAERIEVTEENRKKILKNMEALASLGLRVLALASRTYTQKIDETDRDLDRADFEKDLTFRGLIGIYDPPRPESAGAVRECHQAGIAVHMLTGDHPGTARAIAAQVGILPSRMDRIAKNVADSMVMTASQFDKLSDAQIDALPALPLVVARCAPQTKVRMIEALHRRGKFAAMTGDGVNDSPSLKRADVGIAMGQAGSDVAKDASDIVLTDDNFASILNAIEEGRRMFDNIQKFILHLLAQNIAQALTLLIGLAFKDADGFSVFAISPVEILWIIMVTSSLPDMGLGFERASPDIMRRPPHSNKTGVFTIEVLVDMVVYGVWVAALTLTAFVLVVWGFGGGGLDRTRNCNNSYQGSASTNLESDCHTVFRARATAFACLTWFSLFLAWEMIDMRRSFFRMQPDSKRYFTQWMHDVWRNKFLFWTVLVGFITIFPILYIPVINTDVFRHKGISWEWGIVFIASLLFFLGVEGWKWCKRIYFRRRDAKLGGGRGTDLEDRAFEAYMDGVAHSRNDSDAVSSVIKGNV